MKRITLANAGDYGDYSITVEDDKLTEVFGKIMDDLAASGLKLKKSQDDEGVYQVHGKMWKCSHLYYEDVAPKAFKGTEIDHDESGIYIEFLTD